jgi:hypothetical protein
MEGCAECAAEFARFSAIDSELTGWGEQLASAAPAPVFDRERMLSRLRSAQAAPARHRATKWMPAAALLVAAGLVLALLAPQARTPAGNRGRNADTSQFVEIPYTPPLDPRENTTIVRMSIRVATLIAMGFRISADPDTIVLADVLVGEDGRAHAIRMLSNVEMSGAGD